MELGKLGGRSGWSDVCQAKGAGGGGGGGGVGWWRIALESWSRGICRYKYSWAVKLLLACCAALFLLSPALSRRLPSATNESRSFLGRSSLLPRGTATQNTYVERSEAYGRILVEATMKEELEDSDDGNDYSNPTHNHSGATDESPTIARARRRYGKNRYSHKFSQYTAHYEHRRPSAK